LKNIKKTYTRYRYLFVLPLFCVAGATALEYAIVIPILLLLLMGIVEYSLIMYASSVLEGATTTAAREGKTGYPNPDDETTRQQYVIGAPAGPGTPAVNGLLQNLASGLLKPTSIGITATAYDDFGSIGVPGAGTSGVGIGNQVVVYTASYPWPIVTPMLQNILDNSGSTGVFNITTTAIVKNEPFTPTPPPTPAPTPAPTPPPPPTPAPTPPGPTPSPTPTTPTPTPTTPTPTPGTPTPVTIPTPTPKGAPTPTPSGGTPTPTGGPTPGPTPTPPPPPPPSPTPPSFYNG
jgi:Flp pilus assembly protein TadG